MKSEKKIPWLCFDCEEKDKNDYLTSKECETCGGKISPEEEIKCIYELADRRYEAVVSADDFNAAADYFAEVVDRFSKINYSIKNKEKLKETIEELKRITGDSREKYELCKREAEKIMFNERTYEEAVNHWESARELEKSEKWADSEKEYILAEQQFSQIVSFKDAKKRINRCQDAKKTVHEKAIYNQAEEFLKKAVTIDDYKKAAELFAEVSRFSDAKVKHKMCLECIEKITIEQQYEAILEQKDIAEKETDLDRKSELFQNLINAFEKDVLSEKAKAAVEQCKLLLDECLKQIEDCRIQELFKKASVQYETADELTDYSLRADAFSEMLNEYEKDAKTDEFVKLIGKCRNKLEDANRYLSYDKAVALMGKAERECEFRKAADIFLALTGFKDSAEKGRICTEHANECLRQENYNSAIEKINQAKKITLFNWRSHR